MTTRQAKVYPDRTFQNLVREKGSNISLMWEMRGPPNTDIVWLSCYLLGHSIAIVETFNSGGWNVLTPGQSLDTDATVAEAMARTVSGRPTMTELEALEIVRNMAYDFDSTGNVIHDLKDATAQEQAIDLVDAMLFRLKGESR